MGPKHQVQYSARTVQMARLGGTQPLYDLLVRMLYHNIINVVSMLSNVTMFSDLVFFFFITKVLGNLLLVFIIVTISPKCMFGLLYLVLNSSFLEISLIC